MKVLVTGAGGFIGGHLARRLLEQGHEVATFQRGHYPCLESEGISTIRGDVADSTAVIEAIQGVDAVFHVAALASVWGPRAEFERCNVLGTQNVIAGCRHHRVSKLIFTSSPSVVFDGNHQQGIDEQTPYPPRYLAHYPRTKAIAEQDVLAANDARLATVALRPHLVWGPGDRHLIPRILDRARTGKLRLIDAPGTRIDATFIDNAVDAHIAALDALSVGSACSGRPYFIANGEPMPAHQLIGGILEAAALDAVAPSVSPRFARAMATVLEWFHSIPGVSGEPLLTRFTASQLSTSHWFDLSAAKRDLAWSPRVTTEEGLQALAREFTGEKEVLR